MTIPWNDHQLTLSTWPLWVGAMALVLAHVAVIGLLVTALRTEKRGCLPPIVGSVAAGLAAAAVLLGPPVVAAALADTGAAPCHAGSCTTLIDVFLVPIGGAVVGLAWTVGLGGVAGALLGWARFSGARQLMPASLAALLAASMVAMLPASLGVAWVAHTGVVPEIEVDAPDWVQVGRPVELVATVRHADAASFRVGGAGTLRASAPGNTPYTVIATAGPLTVQRDGVVVAREELGLPQLPLRVGNRWTWRPFSRTGASSRVGFKGGRRTYTEDPDTAVTLEVAGADETRGVRWFLLKAAYPGDNTATFRVAAADGTLLVEDGTPFLAVEPAPDAVAGDEARCDFVPLADIGPCKCPARPGYLVPGLPGPRHCATSTGGGLIEGIFRGVIAVTTLGLVDPGSSKLTKGVVLADFVAGSADAPQAPPQFEEVRDPRVDQALADLGEATWSRDEIAAVKRAAGAALPVDHALAIQRKLSWPDARVEGAVLLLGAIEGDPAREAFLARARLSDGDAEAVRARVGMASANPPPVATEAAP